MSEKIPKATHMGNLQIGETIIVCAVIEDGTRLLTQSSFMEAIGRANRAKGGQGPSALDSPPAFLAAKNLKPFISEDLERSTSPVVFRPINPTSGYRGKAYGYRAELLPAVCDVFLAARETGKLLPSQYHIARQCELLIRALATVGIVALVDEATGYQRDRDQEELQKILEAYVYGEYLPWTKRFPNEFYEEMFRLRGWKRPSSVKRPQLVGKLTNKLVYEKLPQGVLEELQRVNPVTQTGRRRRKHHQHLTPDIGNTHLSNHIAALLALMRISSNWRHFESMVERAFPSTENSMQQSLPGFEDDYEEDSESEKEEL